MEVRIIEYSDEVLLNSSDTSSIKSYLKDVFSYPVLTKEETYELGIRKLNGDKKAEEKLILHNLRLVIWVINYMKKKMPKTTHLTDEDLVQAGNLELIKSVENYNPNLGSFSTYAKQKIEGGIRSIVRINESEISCSNNGVLSKIPAYLSFIENYKLKHGITPSDEMTAEAINVTLSTLKLIKLNLQISTTSANVKIGEDENELIDFLESPDNEEANIIRKISEYEFIITIKQLLSPKEYYVIYHRYLAPVTENNSEMAKRLNGVSSRQLLDSLEKQAFKKLRMMQVNDKNTLDQIFSRLVHKEGIKAYNLREKPIDIEDILTYSYIKDSLTEQECALLDIIIFGKYKCTNREITKTLQISLNTLYNLYDSIKEKIHLYKKDTEKYQAYRAKIVSELKTDLFSIGSLEELKNNKKLKLVANQ